MSIVYMLVLEYFKYLEIESISLKTATMVTASHPPAHVQLIACPHIPIVFVRCTRTGELFFKASCRSSLSPFSGGSMWYQESQL